MNTATNPEAKVATEEVMATIPLTLEEAQKKEETKYGDEYQTSFNQHNVKQGNNRQI